MMQQFQVIKNEFSTNRLVTLSPQEQDTTLADGEIRLIVDSFSFTANNITYAAAGDQLRYWDFFPPAGEQTEGWGVIPVWGFANVTESRCEQVAVGERLFGYFPPATQLVIHPSRISSQRLMDGSAHRSHLAPGYNTYSRVLNEPDYDPKAEPERMLLWPLHITSFCLWDALKDKDWRGASQVIILSASSKTSIGLGYALFKDSEAPATVGVTSAHSIALVESLGIYDQVISYDQLSNINNDIPTVIVDMSGNIAVQNTLSKHLGEQLTYCIKVGLTHWDESQAVSDIGKDRSEFFFAPGHIQQRMKDWGPEGFAERSQRFMREASDWSREWLKIKTVKGLAGLTDIYSDICQGRIPADQGVIVNLKEDR